LFLKLKTLDLATSGFGDGVNEFNPSGKFVNGNPIPDKLLDLFF
jgi:hypothetical protein